jgi:hypothetical protein
MESASLIRMNACGYSLAMMTSLLNASCHAPAGLSDIFPAPTHWGTYQADEEQNNQVSKIKSMVICRF